MTRWFTAELGPDPNGLPLDVPFHAADPTTWNGGQIRGKDQLSRFICEGVSIRDLAVSVSRVRGDNAKVMFHFVLGNEPGVDKLAMIRLALIRQEQALYETIIPWFEVEEGETSTRSQSFVVPKEALAATPAPLVRLTVSTKDDK